jgi:hypothetical protein
MAAVREGAVREGEGASSRRRMGLGLPPAGLGARPCCAAARIQWKPPHTSSAHRPAPSPHQWERGHCAWLEHCASFDSSWSDWMST